GRGGLPDAAVPRAGQALAATQGEEGRQAHRTGHSGGEAGADGVSPVAQAASFRRQEVLDVVSGPARFAAASSLFREAGLRTSEETIHATPLANLARREEPAAELGLHQGERGCASHHVRLDLDSSRWRHCPRPCCLWIGPHAGTEYGDASTILATT